MHGFALAYVHLSLAKYFLAQPCVFLNVIPTGREIMCLMIHIYMHSEFLYANQLLRRTFT